MVAETHPPHESIVYKADNEGIADAGVIIEEICEKYAECLEKDFWPGYPDEEVVLGDEYVYPEFDINEEIEF